MHKCGKMLQCSCVSSTFYGAFWAYIMPTFYVLVDVSCHLSWPIRWVQKMSEHITAFDDQYTRDFLFFFFFFGLPCLVVPQPPIIFSGSWIASIIKELASELLQARRRKDQSQNQRKCLGIIGNFEDRLNRLAETNISWLNGGLSRWISVVVFKLNVGDFQ